MIKLYAVRDEKAELFLTPWPCNAVGQAIREFTQACAPGQQSALSQYPRDFALYEIGVYNQETGVLVATTPVLRVFDGGQALNVHVSQAAAAAALRAKITPPQSSAAEADKIEAAVDAAIPKVVKEVVHGGKEK